MKDAIQLLITAVVLAIAAWAFWHFLGQESFGALSTVGLIVLCVDNIRLRRKLKSER